MIYPMARGHNGMNSTHALSGGAPATVGMGQRRTDERLGAEILPEGLVQR